MNPQRRISVIGAGSMGAQIAQQAALGGIEVTLHDTTDEQLRKAVDSNALFIDGRRYEGSRDNGSLERALGASTN